MSEEQIAEKIQAEENKFMIILGAFLGVVWILLIAIDIWGGGLDGSLYFIYGIFNIGAFVFYTRSRNKKSQEKWIKTTLFEEIEEKKAKEKAEQ